MSETEDLWQDGRVAGLASSLMLFGRIGFWVQLVLLIAVFLLGGYVIMAVGGRAGFGNILSFLGLALPLFTTLWCRRYTGLGQALAEGSARPKPASIRRSLWIGIWASSVGVVVTLISLLGAASTLLLTLLSNPQIGLAVTTVTPGAGSYQISAVDAVSLMALLLTQTAELMVVAISLRLVFLLAACLRTGPRA